RRAGGGPWPGGLFLDAADQERARFIARRRHGSAHFADGGYLRLQRGVLRHDARGATQAAARGFRARSLSARAGPAARFPGHATGSNHRRAAHRRAHVAGCAERCTDERRRGILTRYWELLALAGAFLSSTALSSCSLSLCWT